VRTFGELEFWFASVKVLAIVLFVAFGLYYLWDPARTAQAGSVLLYHDGGFAPYGVQAILRKVPAALFATCGAEIAAVAAMDSANPAANIARTTQTVIVRVVTFYVGSLLIVLMVVPWRSVVSGFSPFVTALDATGVHHAGDVMNIVIFTAILSCLNSGIYVASRVMRGLAEQGDAPAWIGKPDKNGTPQAAVLAVVAAGGALTLASLHSFRGIFDMLLAASGAIMLFIYLLIAAAQIANRRILSREGRLVPRVHLWLYPWSSWLVMAMIVGVLLLMALDRDTRVQEAASVVAALAVLTVYGVARLVRRRHADTLHAASVPD
jgi:AAT family amino acid transporter/GABA permease